MTCSRELGITFPVPLETSSRVKQYAQTNSKARPAKVSQMNQDARGRRL